MNFARRRYAYLLGMGISYLGSVGAMFLEGPSDPQGGIIWGLALGTLIWLTFLVPQLLLQWGLERIVCQRNQVTIQTRALILNIPVLITIGWLLLYQYRENTSIARFEQWIIKPIPKSVLNLRQGGSRGINYLIWVLQCNIGQMDLEAIVKHLRLVSTTETTDFGNWEQRIRFASKLPISLNKDWQAWEGREESIGKLIFFNPSTREAIMVVTY